MTGRRQLLLVVALVVAALWAPAGASADRASQRAGQGHLPPLAAAPGTSSDAPVVAGRSGRWLVDPLGRVVVLRGMNMVAKRPPYLPSALGFGADDARWLRAQGFTSVRLGIIASGVEPARGAFDEAYLDDIAATVGVLRAAGLATLVDLHQDYYTESTGGEGFPGWMVHRAPGLSGLGVGRADASPFDGLWANAGGVQDEIATLWQHVAARLREVPGIVGYDLFNEPYPGSRADECAALAGCPSFDQAVLAPFYRRLIAGVRAEDPTRLVFVEPGVSFNQGATSWLGAVGDARTGFSFHVYCSPVAGLAGCAGRQAGAFANAERQAAGGGQALLMTEFGATDDLGALRSVLDDADRAMVGWEHWAYFNQDPCCARPHEGLVRRLDVPPGPDTVKADKLAVLARPGPVLIAGTPSGWSWDEKAGRLTVSWSTARVRGPASRARVRAAGAARAAGSGSTAFVDEARVSTFELPPASVPGKWSVLATGGRVVSAARERRVRVLADAGTSAVTVVIQRG